MKPSELIDKQIADTPDWRGQMLTRLRALIHEAAPEVTEEWKWGTAVFAHKGNVCATGAFKNHVKINFFHGAALTDFQKLFNAGLDSKVNRSIDFHEGDQINEPDLKELIRAAVEFNKSH